MVVRIISSPVINLSTIAALSTVERHAFLISQLHPSQVIRFKVMLPGEVAPSALIFALK